MNGGVTACTTYRPGDLLWTKIGNYPFWPCMVGYNPVDGSYCRPFNKSKPDSNKIYHVQFFGKKATHGWTTVGGRTFLYEGINQFNAEKEALANAIKDSNSSQERSKLKLKLKNYDVPKSHVESWKVAVEEAEEALAISDIEERFSSYVFIYETRKRKSLKSSVPETIENNTEVTEHVVEEQQDVVEQAPKTKKIKHSPAASLENSLCHICAKPFADVSCSTCPKQFHMNCLGVVWKPTSFQCGECLSGCHSCGRCEKVESDTRKCGHPRCFRFYHPECLKKFECSRPRSNLCPVHTCLSCFKENPCNVMARRGAMISCFRCPSAFHAQESCIPAGSTELVPNTYILCPYHFLGKKKVSLLPHINVNYCVLCAEGGDLVCCEACPNAFHEFCLSDEVPQDEFICDDCIKRKHFYYSMVVWCKIGNYRWWPAKIVHPSKLPNSVKSYPNQPGEFPVQFFGSYDYSWTHRGRVLAYEDKHKNFNLPNNKGRFEVQFRKAVEEAEAAFNDYHVFRNSEILCREVPDQYVKIKVNRGPGGTQIPEAQLDLQCNCAATEENP